MGIFDRKAQSAGFDPAEAMRQAGMDPSAAMAGAGNGMGNVQELMAQRDRIQRLNASGVAATATVVSVQPVGVSAGGVGTETQFELSVTSGPGAGGSISVKQSMVGDSEWYQPGKQVTLKVNPANPQEALIAGGA